MGIKIKHSFLFVLVGIVMVFSLFFNFESKTKAFNLTSNSNHNLKIDTVDGVKYSPNNHKEIAGIVVEATEQGEKVAGFSNLQKYEEYHQKVTERPSDTPKSTMANPIYFYEHTSNHGHGKSIFAYPGTSVSSLSVSWDNRISAVSVAPSSWVKIYKNHYYSGYALTLIGYESKYYTTNLNTWAMPDGTSWNDQISSYQTGN